MFLVPKNHPEVKPEDVIEVPTTTASAELKTRAWKPRQPRKQPAINEAYASVAERLYANGYSPIPLCGKMPPIKGWTGKFCDARPTLGAVLSKWSLGHRGKLLNGVGIATHAGLIVLDLETDDVLAELFKIVPEAERAPACIGRKGRKIFMRSEDGLNHPEWNLSGARTGNRFELLAHGRQGAIPPTKHPVSGEEYRWADPAVTLEAVPLESLPTITAEQVAALHSAFVIDKVGLRAAAKSLARAERREKRAAETVRWNGDHTDFARDMEAICALDYNSENHWRASANAIAAKYGDHAPAWAEFEKWAEQWKPTSAVLKSNKEMRTEAMRNAAEGKGARLGYIITVAKKLGWNATLGRWPGIRMSKSPKAEQRRPQQLTLQSSPIARDAHLYAADTDIRLAPRHHILLRMIHRFSSEVMGTTAWPSTQRLAALTKLSGRYVMSSLSDLQSFGYIKTEGYGVRGTNGGERCIEFTVPPGRTLDELIADRDYGIGHPLDELQGARCPDDVTKQEYITRRAQGGHAPNGADATEVVMVSVVSRGKRGGPTAPAASSTRARREPAGMPGAMSEAEWDAIMSGPMATDRDDPNTVVDVPDQSAVRPQLSPAITQARAEADRIEPHDRSIAHWLASSWVPDCVSELVAKSRAEKPARRLAGALLWCCDQGIQQMDAKDMLDNAVNAITFDRDTKRNHALTAIPSRMEPGKFQAYGKTLVRLYERFILELKKHGLDHPDLERIVQEREYRKSAFGRGKPPSLPSVLDEAIGDRPAPKWPKATNGYAVEQPKPIARNAYRDAKDGNSR